MKKMTDSKELYSGFFISNLCKGKELLIIITKKLTPINIVLIYAIVGALWVMLSDKVLALLESDPVELTRLQTYKGWIYVIGTAWMLYLLIDSSMKAIKRSKDELRASEERYRLVINNTTDGLWEWDMKTGKIIYPSEWKRVIGYGEDALSEVDEALNIEQLVHPDELVEFKDNIIKYLDEKISNYKSEIRIKSKSGEYLWFQIRGQAIWNEYGKPIRMIGTVTEITERKVTEAALKKTMEENKKLLNEVIEYDKLKTEFFANISHEFRTPLNVILAVVQVLEIHAKKGQNTVSLEKANRYMRNVKQNCYRLLKLINNLIDVTRIDSGFLKVQMKNEDIVDIVKHIAGSVEEFVSVKELKLTFSSNISGKIMACDADKIERIILNLISNSIKFTKPGGKIFLSIYDLGESVNISVKDTGIGIEKDKLSIIFDRFRQVNSSLSKDSEGSGIGLSLVKSLVEMHSGEIRASSEPGIGTEFIITLPVKRLSDEEIYITKADIKQEGVERAAIEFSDIYMAERNNIV